jgi:hypothetical protein
LLKRFLVACALRAGSAASYVAGACADFVWTLTTNRSWAQFRLARSAGVDLSKIADWSTWRVRVEVMRANAFNGFPLSETAIYAVFPREEDADAR